MKIKIYLFLLIVLSGEIAHAQSWLWAENFTGNTQQAGDWITLHPSGNIYCLGEYEPAGSLIAGQTTISAVGSYNGFISEFDSSGNFLTITNVPITSPNQGQSIYQAGLGPRPIIDDSGSLYIGVGTNGPTLVDTINVNGGLISNLISKWTTDCRCLWVKGVAGMTNNIFYRGGIYITGNYQGAIQIDTFHVSGYNHDNTAYTARLNGQGTCQWIKRATGGNTVIARTGIAGSHIYMSVYTDTCFVYDTLQICGQSGIGISALVQTDTNGSVIWAKAIAASDALVRGAPLAVAKNGDCYFGGAFDATLYIGDDTLHKLGNELGDYFIAKFDSAGNLLWTKQVPINNSLAVYAMSVDATGSLYLTGYFTGTETFGNQTVTAQSASDLFITRISSGGTFIGTVTVPGAQALDITEDSLDNAIVTGMIKNTVVFGNITLTGSSVGDFFVAKLSAIVDTGTGFSILPPTDSLLQIYANPSRGLFTVVVPQSIVQASNGNLMVYDSQGGLITNQQVDISGTHVQVDLGEITRGVYTVLLSANGKEFRGRVVIQ